MKQRLTRKKLSQHINGLLVWHGIVTEPPTSDGRKVGMEAFNRIADELAKHGVQVHKYDISVIS